VGDTISAMIAQIIGLVLNFLGSFWLFWDNYRIAKMFTKNSLSLGWGEGYESWFWRWAGRGGLALLALGFLFQLLALVHS